MNYKILLLLTSLFWAGNFVVGKSLVGHASPIDADDHSVDYCSRLPCTTCMVEGKKDSTTTKCPFPLIFNGNNRSCSI